MTNPTALTLLQRLKHEPTVEAWKQAFQSTQRDDFDDVLERLGGIEAFVQATVDNAVVPSASESAMIDALEEVVASWQPAIPAPASATERMLRLIASRTPPSGFRKVLGHLSTAGKFRATDRPTPTDGLAYLDDLALSALRKYVLEPPHDVIAFPAFPRYLSLLRSYLNREGFRGRACARLLELGQARFADNDIQTAFTGFPSDVIPALAGWLLNTQWPDRAALLRSIYERAREDQNLMEELLAALRLYRASVAEVDEIPYLFLRNGDAVELSRHSKAGSPNPLQPLQRTSLHWKLDASQAGSLIEQVTGHGRLHD